MDMETPGLKFHFALTAEQVVSPSESDCPRRSLGFDESTPFETKLKVLDKVGIMVMHNGDRKHGIDLPAILQSVPDCLVRVGEGMFDDASFDPAWGKDFLIQSLEMHKAIVKDVSRLYTENTVHPWPNLRPENMAQKLLIEVEHGLRNIMLMPPCLLDAPAYWEAIAAVLPQAEAMVRGKGQ
jgi:hypothetical protein